MDIKTFNVTVQGASHIKKIRNARMLLKVIHVKIMLLQLFVTDMAGTTTFVAL